VANVTLDVTPSFCRDRARPNTRSEYAVSKKDKAKNQSQIAKGKAKEVVGHAVGDEELESEGKMDQSKGNIKQAVEHVKDALQ